MKINKLILPIITIISLSSCSEPIVENSSYITDKEEVQKQIVNILDASATKAQSDTYGLDVSSTRGEIIKFNMNDNGKNTKIEGSISPFSLYLGVNNLSGNKDEAKFGLTSSGLNISAKSIFPEDFEYRPFDYRVSTGETSIYFMNGTLYADLSKSNLKSVILNAAESYLPSVISQGSVYKEIIDNTLGDMRIKFEASTLPFPVVKTSETKNIDYNQLVSDGLRWIDEASLNWLDYIKLYENKDGTVQFDVNIDKPSLQKILDSQKDNLEGTFFYNPTITLFDLNISFKTDSNKIINYLSISHNIEVETDYQEKHYKVVADGNFSINFTYGKNNIVYPDLKTFDDYLDVSSLLELFN